VSLMAFYYASLAAAILLGVAGQIALKSAANGRRRSSHSFSTR